MAKWLRKWRRGWLYVRSNTKNAKSLFTRCQYTSFYTIYTIWLHHARIKWVPVLLRVNNHWIKHNWFDLCTDMVSSLMQCLLLYKASISVHVTYIIMNKWWTTYAPKNNALRSKFHGFISTTDPWKIKEIAKKKSWVSRLSKWKTN